MALITLDRTYPIVGSPPRAKIWTPPSNPYAGDWYVRSCCQACGCVNGNGGYCPRTHRCLCCETVVCGGWSAACPVCHGVLDGFSNSREQFIRWEKAQQRKARKVSR